MGDICGSDMLKGAVRHINCPELSSPWSGADADADVSLNATLGLATMSPDTVVCMSCIAACDRDAVVELPPDAATGPVVCGAAAAAPPPLALSLIHI